ncbi:RraA family protein [Salinicola acroporae]|uniref:Putative 4-hydroxy-4-methyl-2-oxoglutarate aldolase n=1 Tax=Salinicola acroporae TaxID=1541440 RepID=A0ABT6I5F8_9GAMM|nr:RraA family protein [Salinicola acroporae]MDH4572861.1 4-hydroxy-4-methyl-2-oxoglutarate aldolase [Salinicola acroporae]
MRDVFNKFRGKSAERLIAALSGLQPASLGHYLDVALPYDIKALNNFCRCIGTALTVHQPTSDSTPVHLAIELLRPGDVLVIDRAGNTEMACVGEMVATAAQLKGAQGIIVNGVITDLEEVTALGMPLYAKGTTVVTTRASYAPGARLTSEIKIGRATVKTGDVIFGDLNGVLCIDPLEDEIWKIVEKAKADEEKEMDWKNMLKGGASLADLNGVDRDRFELNVCSIPEMAW